MWYLADDMDEMDSICKFYPSCGSHIAGTDTDFLPVRSYSSIAQSEIGNLGLSVLSSFTTRLTGTFGSIEDSVFFSSKVGH